MPQGATSGAHSERKYGRHELTLISEKTQRKAVAMSAVISMVRCIRLKTE